MFVFGADWLLTVLVDEHSDADSGDVESVQEVLDVVLLMLIHLIALPHLKDTLSSWQQNVTLIKPRGKKSLYCPFPDWPKNQNI